MSHDSHPWLAPFFDAHGPGAAVAVVPDGDTPRFACHGLADLETRRPITPDTLFELASASKPFTAVAVLRLVAEGRLGLDTEVDTVLDGFARPDQGRAVRVRDLLQHTAGLHDYLEQGMFTSPEEATPHYIAAQLPAWSRAARPGIAHVYSNTHYVVLASLVEAVAGTDFATFLREQVFAAAGLERTFAGDGQGIGQPIAGGYQAAAYGLSLVAPVEPYPLATLGDGGVTSCARDILRFLDRLWAGDLVPSELVRAMGTPGRLDDGTAFPYGLGFQVETAGDARTWIGHGGSWTDSTTLMGRYAPGGVIVVVLSNEAMAPVERISRWCAAQVAGSDP